MHPMVLESLTEQRLQELRSGVSGRPSRRGRGNPRSRRGRGPVSRTQERVGVWMVETGLRMVESGGTTPSVPPIPNSLTSASL
jgi:hypothetical protein